jgi:hypothetical protein
MSILTIILAFGSVFLLALLAALFGIRMALEFSPAGARKPPQRRLAVVCIVAALVVFPAFFVVGRLVDRWGEFSNGAQAGVGVMVIALGCSALAAMALTFVLVARRR